MIENSIKERFRELKLGEVKSIETIGEHKFLVKTWLKEYIVIEKDGLVHSIENLK